MKGIKFLGYAPDKNFKMACTTERTDPMPLESFYAAVNQPTTDKCCSCCKQEVVMYAVMPVDLPIKAYVLSLCLDCCRRLPDELEVVISCGAPPQLIAR